jgi:hypothetical protein
MTRQISHRSLLPAACLALLTAGVSLANQSVLDFDKLAAAHPSKIDVVFENGYVWVAHFKLAPGEELPVHSSGSRFVYALSDFDLLYVPNYEPERMTQRAGQAHWHQSEDHAIRNRGKTAAEFVAVIPKPTPRPGPRPVGPCEVAQRAPQKAKVLFENNEGRVIRIELKPGERLPAHFASNRAIY